MHYFAFKCIGLEFLIKIYYDTHGMALSLTSCLEFLDRALLLAELAVVWAPAVALFMPTEMLAVAALVIFSSELDVVVVVPLQLSAKWGCCCWLLIAGVTGCATLVW